MMQFLSQNLGFLLFLGFLVFLFVIAWQMRHRFSIIGEFFMFLGERKLWWMLPIIVILILLSVVIVIGNNPVALIYTLF